MISIDFEEPAIKEDIDLNANNRKIDLTLKKPNLTEMDDFQFETKGISLDLFDLLGGLGLLATCILCLQIMR